MRCLRDMTSRISNFTVQHNNNKRLKSRGSYVQCTHMNASTAYTYTAACIRLVERTTHTSGTFHPQHPWMVFEEQKEQSRQKFMKMNKSERNKELCVVCVRKERWLREREESEIYLGKRRQSTSKMTTNTKVETRFASLNEMVSYHTMSICSLLLHFNMQRLWAMIQSEAD